MKFFTRLFASIFALSCVFAATPATAQTTLFADEFNGTALNSSAWSVYDSTWFLQRTQFGNTPVFGTEGTTKYTRLRLDTFTPDSRYSGTHLRGTEMLTKQLFNLGNGVEIEARLRAPNLPRGIIFAFFSLGEKGVWPDAYTRDEIDFENLTNLGSNKLWLNIWNDWNPNGGGANAETNGAVVGLNWNNWTTYKIRWLPNRTEWIVNNGAGDVLVRTETGVLPNDAQSIRFNIWAASADWGTAYDAGLTAASSSSANKTHYFDVDYVRVKSIGAPTPPATPGTGDGLKGEYYDGANFTGTKSTRVDPKIDFNWAANAPISGFGTDTFSTRWTGQVQPQFTQTYTFTTKSDDGVRLWVNNQLLINQWKNQAATEYSGSIALTAGQKYAIKMEYFDNTGSASAQLLWSSTSTPRQIIPQSQLYSLNAPTPPADIAAPVVSISTPVNAASYQTLASISGTASDAGGSNLSNVRVRLQRKSDSTYWNGSSWAATETEVAASGTANWTFALPALSGDEYSVRASARDGANNTGVSSVVSFIIDAIAPTATIATPVHTWSYKTLSQATGTAGDAVGIATVRVRLFRISNGTYWNGTAWTTTEADAPATGTSSWSFAMPSLSDGQYSLQATARDRAGNAGVSSATNFNWDVTAPTLSVIEPKANTIYPSLPAANGTAADANGLSEVRCIVQRGSDKFYWNGNTWVASWTEVLAQGTSKWSFTMPALTKGQYTFWAVARDWPGNQTYANGVVFNVP